jgi:metal-responsive CopG/Arc/MetJ family transcriptional regulator
MLRSEKIAVSLDPELLDRAERVRRRTGESRSALVSRALRLLTREEEKAQRIVEYVRAYREHPETAEEIASIRAVAKRSLAAIPWEEK